MLSSSTLTIPEPSIIKYWFMQAHTLFRRVTSLKVFVSLYPSSESLVVDQNDIPFVDSLNSYYMFSREFVSKFVRNHILINDIKTRPILFDLLN